MAKKKKPAESSDIASGMKRVFFATIDPRRRQEVAEGGMLSEDDTAMANLSPHAIHREYPKKIRRAHFGVPPMDAFRKGSSAIDSDYEME